MATPLPLFQVDAFTDAAFGGNPAAVCLLEGPRESEWMQRVAAEMNLSETAFVSARATTYGGCDLRWFTPTVEVPLCGHATLAAAHTLWDAGRLDHAAPARFHTCSGLLTARRVDEGIEMDFPARPVGATAVGDGVLAALRIQPGFTGATVPRLDGDLDVLLAVESESVVRAVRPDFKTLGRVAAHGTIVTAPSDSDCYDFVSRYFAPAAGIDEDPVTGAAHCALIPYWAERLDRTTLVGYQASPRGGVVHGRLEGGRVKLVGRAVTVLRGELVV